MRKHTLIQDEASRFNLRQEPRYQGVFTREQSSLASIPNNARICKNKFEKDDSHPIGAQGTVLGSIGVPDLGVLYFVKWDSSPYLAIDVYQNRIRGVRETNIFKTFQQ